MQGLFEFQKLFKSFKLHYFSYLSREMLPLVRMRLGFDILHMSSTQVLVCALGYLIRLSNKVTIVGFLLGSAIRIDFEQCVRPTTWYKNK
jgi:hypothetical protein